MILPITLYGSPILRRVADEVSEGEDITKLIADMRETLSKADGIGLAAPQIGVSKRIFIIDTTPLSDEKEDVDFPKNFKQVYINPEIIEASETSCGYEEGCLSIPNLYENVVRPEKITIEFLDENFEHHTETYDGFLARIFQHEYDHLDGRVFVDKVSPLRRRLLKGKLTAISKGKVQTRYRVNSK